MYRSMQLFLPSTFLYGIDVIIFSPRSIGLRNGLLCDLGRKNEASQRIADRSSAYIGCSLLKGRHLESRKATYCELIDYLPDSIT